MMIEWMHDKRRIKYAQLFIYTIINVLVTWIYYGWSALASLLFTDGAYSWLCGKSGDIRSLDGQDLGKFICDAQDLQVQFLFSLALMGHLMGSCFAGFSADMLGLRMTAIIGSALTAASWVGLSLSGPNMQLYEIAFIIMGAGVDLILLPTMRLSVLFPNNRGLVVAIIGGASSVSPGMASLMFYYKKQHPSTPTKVIFMVYAIIGPGLALCLSPFIFPKYQYILLESTQLDNIDLENLKLSLHRPINQEDPYALNELLPLVQKEPHRHNESSLWASARAANFLLIGILMPLCTSGASTFYQIASSRMLPSNALQMMDMLVPAAAIPSILLGRLSDRIGPIPIMAGLNLFGIMMLSALLLPFHFSKMLSVLFFIIFISFTETCIYVYLDETVEPKHVATLFGMSICMGSISSLATYSVFNFIGIKMFKGDLSFLLAILIGAQALLAPSLLKLALTAWNGRKNVVGTNIWHSFTGVK